ncbi:hypothetical protein SPKIRA_08040 [Sphingomonas paucimobilis]|uniref:hypothetical protein n=1 Tax=Sphingomonas paucimobilis TaxID=13689 RepID=UPI0015DD4D03|nr:hypothetical protein [Sphingomonas paucimobilis]BCI69974.1 hypothetical protein SPKIRA_08040 [Sphingomonas paucimobilis]
MTPRQTPDAVREAVARVQEALGHAEGHESQSVLVKCADLRAILAALDSRAGDAGEGFGAVLERWDSVIPLSHDERTKLIAELTAATPAPAVDAQQGDDEGPCTDCEDTGITTQTERACSCEAGDQYRAPAVDAVPAGEVQRLRALYETHLAAPFDKSPRNGAPSEEWELWYAANRARKELLDAVPALLASLSHGEGRK